MLSLFCFLTCTLFAHKSYQRISTIRIIYKVSIITVVYVFWWRIINRKVSCSIVPFLRDGTVTRLFPNTLQTSPKHLPSKMPFIDLRLRQWNLWIRADLDCIYWCKRKTSHWVGYYLLCLKLYKVIENENKYIEEKNDKVINIYNFYFLK